MFESQDLTKFQVRIKINDVSCVSNVRGFESARCYCTILHIQKFNFLCRILKERRPINSSVLYYLIAGPLGFFFGKWPPWVG